MMGMLTVELHTVGRKSGKPYANLLTSPVHDADRMGRDEANALLDARLRKSAFRRDMDTLLRPGLPKFDVDEGAEIVRTAYFRHLKP